MPIRFFYLPRGRGYNYQPRFYDERKEELERRKRRIDRELGFEEDGAKDAHIPQIKGEMRRHLKIVNKKRKRTSTTIMLVVLAFLIFLTYMLLRI
jgi:hypothetical protein